MVKKILDGGTRIVAAAGNDGKSLDSTGKSTANELVPGELNKHPLCKTRLEEAKKRPIQEKSGTYYPAMYDKRIVVVGNIDQCGIRHHLSNYGSIVDLWEPGQNVTGYGITMTGTSQSTALVSGKIARQIKKQCVR